MTFEPTVIVARKCDTGPSPAVRRIRRKMHAKECRRASRFPSGITLGVQKSGSYRTVNLKVFGQPVTGPIGLFIAERQKRTTFLTGDQAS